jgi:hypothetical protein
MIAAEEIRTKKIISQEVNSQKINITGNDINSSEFESSSPASASASIKSENTAGTAILPFGQTELIVYNNHLTSKSLVYLTPNDDTNNQIVYAKSNQIDDQGQPYFIIKVNQPIDRKPADPENKTGTSINWWIIN